MSQIIAETYELIEQIGTGGGGIVYLGRHLRLDKPVVLKADKRTLAAKPEVLRREVDALKNLSHTYIPQVYDFVAEGETVYTVMDYIEGESLDKPLKRGERFPQAQVVEWACQLLEAVRYLHSRPPHGILHSDIKPANVMLTPQGDIRLIDFNIALALGEDGAVRVGYSRGYASPEHYGIDYTAAGTRTFAGNLDATEVLGPTESVSSGQVRHSSSNSGGSSCSRKKSVLLDVRSDIYSLGATLYHLFSGVGPAVDAREVMPIHVPGVSPAISAIIQKAMAPNPDERYQTAQEMLDAFERLHDNDPRARRHRRRARISAIVLSAMFLIGGACVFAGLRQMEQAQEAARIAAEAAEAAERAAKQALAAVSDAEDAYRRGDLPQARRRALDALSLDSPYASRGQKALTDALGVYDLSGGFRAHSLIALPSEPLKAVLSPGGTRTAAMTLGELLVFDTGSGQPLASLPAEPSALSEAAFLSEDVLLYAGESGIRAYDLAGGRELWSGAAATGIAVSGDGSTAAAVYKDENQAVVYDASSGAVLRVVSFQNRAQEVPGNDILVDPETSLFVLNGDGTQLAVSFSDGALMIYDLRDSANDLEVFDGSEGILRYDGGFCRDFFAVAFSTVDRYFFRTLDVPGAQWLDRLSGSTPFFVQADENGVFLSAESVLVELDPETGEQYEAAYTDLAVAGFAAGSEYALVSTPDGALSFFNADARQIGRFENDQPYSILRLAGEFAVTARWDDPCLRVWALEDHPEAQLFSYDGGYPHDEARVSADGSTYMLFRYDRFRLYGADGEILADVEIPDSADGAIYDQQYRRDEAGSRLEVTYYSGLVRTYSAADGSLLSEIQGEKPDESLYEEFYTSRLRIESPFHGGTPAAYDRETGELVRELEPEAFLTYVTELADGRIITEYLDAQGQHYGLLLDENCETLAYLPNLCDIIGGDTLVFDDMAGSLRQCRIYSLQELKALAES